MYPKRILIIEDEPLAAERMIEVLKEIHPEAQVLEVLDSVDGALAWLSEHDAPDLILSDIHLADGTLFFHFCFRQNKQSYNFHKRHMRNTLFRLLNLIVLIICSNQFSQRDLKNRWTN